MKVTISLNENDQFVAYVNADPWSVTALIECSEYKQLGHMIDNAIKKPNDRNKYKVQI